MKRVNVKRFYRRPVSEDVSDATGLDRRTPRSDSISGFLSIFTPMRLTTATSSSSFECLYMCRYGLCYVFIIRTQPVRICRETYLRRTNHRRSHAFSFASTMTMRCPFLVGASLHTQS